MSTNGYCNGYLGDVLAAHEDENTDFLMSMMTDVADRMIVLKQQVQDMISAIYGDFHRVPRMARRMKCSLKLVTEQVEALDSKIKAKAVPNLKNSISEMTELSKRIAEISLMGKIVDELVQLNNLFVGAQDFQRDKKYFDAVKSFEMLHLQLENASDEAKLLKVFQALVAETSKSRVFLQDLMTDTLQECFQYQVTTGIDPSKISYYTLKVDKSRKEDFEESFQALHYLKNLDSFFEEFAAWLKNYIISPIILHCCSVSIDNKEGKYVILKVETDFTQPKSDFRKVFANLSFALTFLNTYLGVKVGGNSTIMSELGKLTSNDFCSTLISHCLADTIPSHSNQLEEYKVVISATEDFHNSMKAIGFLDGNNSNLTDYTTNADKLCATKTTKLLLVRAREIILKDLYDTMEVEIVPEALVKHLKKGVPKNVDSTSEVESSPEPTESPENFEVNKSMLADIEKMNQEFIDSVLQENAGKTTKNLKDIPTNKDLDWKKNPSKGESKVPARSKEISERGQRFSNDDSVLTVCPIKDDLEQSGSPVKVDPEQIGSPVMEHPKQTGSPVKDDPKHIRSINVEDSEQKQNLVTEDSLVCPGEIDCLHEESPASKNLEQTPDSAKDDTHDEGGRVAEKSPIKKNEAMPIAISTESEDSNNDDKKVNNTLQGPNASQQNLSQEGNANSNASPVAFKTLRLLSDSDEEATIGESIDEELLEKTYQHAAQLETITATIETSFDLSGAIFAFPKCQISKSANELIVLLNEVLNDCIGTSSKCARNLFKTARMIVELYCAIAPIYFKEYLETIPQQAALFHNNCLYIAHSLLTLGHMQRLLLPEGAQAIGSFADQVIVLRTLGASIFLTHMQIQRNQILDIIRNCGLSTLRECSTLTQDTERALRQCVRQLEKLKSVWQPVLPLNVYINTMACLMNSFLDELINRVVTVQDIPAETASQLVKMFGVVITRVKAIFPDANIVEVFENWEMFQELVLILGANLKFIKDRWSNGQGPLALHFTPEQLRQLIRALFQNTERRSAVLAEIH